MLFYIAIFLACLVAGLLIPWLFRSLSGLRKVFEKTTRPLSKIQSTSHLRAYAESSKKQDPLVPELALATANSAEARKKMGGGVSYYDPRKEYSVPHQSTMLLNRTERLTRQERQVVERATGLVHTSSYKVSREIRIPQNNSKSDSKPVVMS